MSDDEGPPPAKIARFGEIDASQVKDSAAAIAAGIAAGNVEVVGVDAETMDLPQDEDEKKRQEKILQEFEARRKLQALVVPTNDLEVRQRLRALREPITLFGERQMERRDRLRKFLLQAVEEGRDVGDKEAEDELMEQVALQNELFYTEGPQELLDARERLAKYSLVRAKQRTESQRRKQNDPDEDDEAEASAVTKSCQQLANQCSELGDERPIQSCGFSPDGGLFATAGWGGTIKLWSVPACEKKLVIGKAHEERLTGLSWHPDARLSLGPELANIGVASADCTATLWSLEGKKLQTLEGHTNRLARCCFHPMGAHFGTASYDKSWILWDVATGQALLEQEGHSRAVYGLAFQNDGSLAVSGGLDAIGRLWDLRTGRSIHVMKGHAKGILSCAFHPNGYQVVTGSLDHTARVWDLRKRECVYTLPGHRHLISEVKFEPMDGHYFITTGYDNLIKVWSSSNYSLVKILAGHENKVMSADICPDGSGLIASVSYDRTIKYWMPEEDFSALADGPSAMEA